MKRIISDSADFSRLIQEDCIYVDKTELLYNLISGERGSRFFIARPRRFGKSLMLSTLENVFCGNRGLFKGLAIDKRNYDWKPRPVVHIDMSSVVADNSEDIKKNLMACVLRLSKKNDVTMVDRMCGTPSSCFGIFLDEMASQAGEPVVVLIDEYDAPINRMIEANRDPTEVSSLLHDFYMQLKANDSNIRFLMMTGVSKFAKLSVFSGLNNLKDLTLEPDYAQLFGYTVDEIRHYFEDYLNAFAKSADKEPDQALNQLLEWYDGYRFSPYSEVRVTNPVSLASALDTKRFEAFWDETGHSSLVYRYLKERCVIPAQLDGVMATRADLNFCNVNDAKSPALLFQTGYLTIDRIQADGRLVFRLPNKEVRDSLTSGMWSFIYREQKDRVLDRLNSARKQLDLNPESVDRILEDTLNAAFNALPYDWKVSNEPEARRMLFFYFNLMGADVVGEEHSSIGRSDVVLRLENAVFIFELKYDHTSDEALRQAEGMNYAAPFLNGDRTVYIVGVNYNSKLRKVDPPMWKRVGAVGSDAAWNEESGSDSSGPTGPYCGDRTEALVTVNPPASDKRGPGVSGSLIKG